LPHFTLRPDAPNATAFTLKLATQLGQDIFMSPCESPRPSGKLAGY